MEIMNNKIKMDEELFIKRWENWTIYTRTM